MSQDSETDRDCRNRIYAALQGESPFTGETTPGSAVITGWVVVAEWMASDGYRWLTLNSGDPNGERLPIWTVAGYCEGARDLATTPDNNSEDE